MNKIISTDDKVFVIREYCDAEDVKPDASNDILEYLYDIKDILEEGIDRQRARVLQEVHNKNSYHESLKQDISRYRLHPEYHLRISHKNLNKIDEIIYKVRSSDKGMLAVVWTLERAVLSEPRLVNMWRLWRSYLNLFNICFDQKRLFHLSDKPHQANAVSFIDENDRYTEVKILDDCHYKKHYDFWNVRDILTPSKSAMLINKEANCIYTEADSNLDNIREGLASINEDIIRCKDCGNYFLLGYREKCWYADKGLVAPKRCPSCRKSKKDDNNDKET